MRNGARCVIVGGAPIAHYDRAKAALRDGDYFIYCDCGLHHLSALGSPADLVIGDFDSYRGARPDVKTITLPAEKDDTDTIYAVKEGLTLGFSEFLLLGAVGGRFDHSMANVSALLYLDRLGKRATLIDDSSDMRIVSSSADVTDDCRFFSLVALGGTARGVSITDAKFPLHRAEIACDYQYGVSNEVLPGKTAHVTVEEGALLLIRVFA